MAVAQEQRDLFISDEDFKTIVDIIVHHSERKQFIIEILNGLNTWLFKILSNYQMEEQQAKKACFVFGEKITGHLNNIYCLEKFYGRTEKSYWEYFHLEDKVPKYALSYIMNSFYTIFFKNMDDYKAAVITLLISLNRDEDEFEEFRSGLSGLDIRKVVMMYFIFKKAQANMPTGDHEAAETEAAR